MEFAQISAAFPMFSSSFCFSRSSRPIVRSKYVPAGLMKHQIYHRVPGNRWMLSVPMEHVFAVDIGGTRIKAGRVDRDGRMAASRHIDPPASLPEFRLAARRLTAELAPNTAA